MFLRLVFSLHYIEQQCVFKRKLMAVAEPRPYKQRRKLLNLDTKKRREQKIEDSSFFFCVEVFSGPVLIQRTPDCDPLEYQGVEMSDPDQEEVCVVT